MAIVSKLISFSSVDGPGNRFAIFLQGCNFNCVYCHNPETIAKNSEYAQVMEVADIVTEILKVKAFIRGITVSGGECTLQMNFLEELFDEVHKLGLTCMVDTNGSILLRNHEDFVSKTDGFMLDVKNFINDTHLSLTGVSNVNVIENLNYLISVDKLAEVRTVVAEEIPHIKETIEDVAKKISETDIIYKLIKYRPMGVRVEYLKKLKVPKNEFMESLEFSALANGARNVVII